MNRQATNEKRNILRDNALCSSGTELNIQESIQGTPRFGVPFLRLESHVTVRTDERGSANGCAAQFRRTNRMPINNGQHPGPARGKTGVIPFLGPAIEKQMMKASAQARAFRESTARSQASHSQSRAVESYDRTFGSSIVITIPVSEMATAIRFPPCTPLAVTSATRYRRG
jgi:hypothetical protein